MKLRDHTFLGMTHSLCPDCLTVVPAKIIVKRGRVYFRKHCPTHGTREDYVCSDASQFDNQQYATPGKIPVSYGTATRRGCPYDCGLCPEHEQHTCIALLEITSDCNLTCPMCFAASAPGGKHLSLRQCRDAIDCLVAREGRAEVLQISGGEPTIHPQFADVLQYACDAAIDVVMVNTNGIRIANDDAILQTLARHRDRAEVYLQFDGMQDSHYRDLRGANLVATKQRALQRLADHDIHTTLVCTLQSGVNEDQVGAIIELALANPSITGVSFQPATYTGRSYQPADLETRITFPDVVAMIANQVSDTFCRDDFLPLPCAHPNAHSLAYAVRDGDNAIALGRIIDLPKNMDLLANGIVFTRERARQLIEQYLLRNSSPTACRSCDDEASQLSKRFFAAAAEMSIKQSDLLRITITSFMDAYNFDLRQLMKSCVHHVLPSGHLIPFSAYNVLYRDGHLPLPPLVSQPPHKVDASLPILTR